MQLVYRYNKDVIYIGETPNGEDMEFEIRILADVNWESMKELKKSFEADRIVTDVLFYAYENHHYQVIVRKDYYIDFILGLLKYQLIESAEWKP